ncbi:hypothetical protein [Paenibacillus odorifer]|uniref:Uncharacterized protein n=1 Tax=Paenibacillus odorifer TaxID=189426 RepID=A0A1R0Y1B5_9BACL|nr:hypothetical protein [Paenibacillus odorifer]OMD41125.1 hypothetical protein BSK52_11890 [Paenibacillus odorifer]
MKEEIVLFKIHKGLKDRDHYEATRKHWRMSKKRIDYIKYAVGINQGKVECVYQPTSWVVVEEGELKGRLQFEGSEASSDIIHKLQRVQDQLLKKFGAGNPVAYISLSEVE